MLNLNYGIENNLMKNFKEEDKKEILEFCSGIQNNIRSIKYCVKKDKIEATIYNMSYMASNAEKMIKYLKIKYPKLYNN